MEALIGRINAARKPVLLIGSGTQYTRAWQEVIDFAEKFQIPVLTSYKRQDAFPNNHPNYAGNLLTSNKEAQRLAYDESDLLIVLGCRLNQQTTGAFTFRGRAGRLCRSTRTKRHRPKRAPGSRHHRRRQTDIARGVKAVRAAAQRESRCVDCRATCQTKRFCTPQDRPTRKSPWNGS